MDNQGLVSVIIPTHKGSDNICRAVDSVLSQTYQNIEVIVVDDNGLGCEEQKKTEEAMGKYSGDSRVKYLTREVNKNGSAARNTGLRASRGEYIAFLDDDDAFHADNIEKHLELLSTLPEDFGLTYCGMRNIRQGMPDEIIHPTGEGKVLFDFLLRKMRVGTSLVVIRREVFDVVGEWDESFFRHQDWELLTRILHQYKMARVDSVGIDRYVTNRHGAKNPDTFAKYREHFLEKIGYIIDEFDEETKERIYDVHYLAVGLRYFKSGKLGKSIKWAKKTSKPVRSFLSFFRAGFVYIGKKIKR